MSYCAVAHNNPHHKAYHDEEYGFPLYTDAELFERLTLEINQAGLSWITILKKRGAFHEAYDGFDIDTVAGYGDVDRQRLLSDARIIRNRLKIDATIENARRIRALREDYGSFHTWLAAHHPLSKDEWVKLFRQTFRFTGGEIVGEFLMSTGWLPGAHERNCPVFTRIARIGVPWLDGVTGV